MKIKLRFILFIVLSIISYMVYSDPHYNVNPPDARPLDSGCTDANLATCFPKYKKKLMKEYCKGYIDYIRNNGGFDSSGDDYCLENFGTSHDKKIAEDNRKEYAITHEKTYTNRMTSKEVMDKFMNQPCDNLNVSLPNNLEIIGKSKHQQDNELLLNREMLEQRCEQENENVKWKQEWKANHK